MTVLLISLSSVKITEGIIKNCQTAKQVKVACPLIVAEFNQVMLSLIGMDVTGKTQCYASSYHADWMVCLLFESVSIVWRSAFICWWKNFILLYFHTLGPEDLPQATNYFKTLSRFWADPSIHSAIFGRVAPRRHLTVVMWTDKQIIQKQVLNEWFNFRVCALENCVQQNI